jgi:hypothetical protein
MTTPASWDGGDKRLALIFVGCNSSQNKNQDLLAQKEKEAQNSWQTKCSGQMPYQPVIL